MATAANRFIRNSCYYDGKAFTVGIVIETAPGIKGASASARNKPATLSTGLVVQVPEYLSAGERIRIHIEESRYMGRAD